MLTQRRAVRWTIVLGVLALFMFVPWLRDHRSVVGPVSVLYLAVVATVGVIRGKPEGIRVLVLSVACAVLLAAVIVVVYMLAATV